MIKNEENKNNTDFTSLVRDFHKKFNALSPNYPMYPPDKEVMLRVRLMSEEFAEAVKAMEAKSMPEVAKELADLVYVTVGTAVAYGIDFTKAFYAVHMSNMTKSQIKDAGGKVLKGVDYVPPDMTVALTRREAND
jgi:predicted HAD superfamily Cof-like phosphohydrolase